MSIENDFSYQMGDGIRVYDLEGTEFVTVDDYCNLKHEYELLQSKLKYIEGIVINLYMEF